ncbi:hypothetical protein B0H19DRAFT_1238643 [Mycena capillaripes]|nr:hypothetical protein B0H19DRAFT_1238643 [Mycena capillaripes]
MAGAALRQAVTNMALYGTVDLFRDLWITSRAYFDYIIRIRRWNSSFVCQLAGIRDIHRHLAKTCRSLTISVYTTSEGKYTSQCRDLIGSSSVSSATARPMSPPSTLCLSTASRLVTGGHAPAPNAYVTTREYPLFLTELHVTFAYTSPPPALLLDAPRGTFFPPPSPHDLPPQCRFDEVRRLVVWDANPDFVAFLTTACPLLETIESTAQFSAEDARLVFVRLPRTETWGPIGGDAKRRWGPPPEVSLSKTDPASAADPEAPVQKRRNSIWHLFKRILQKRN